MKETLIFICFLSLSLFTGAQTVLTINGANAGTTTLYVNNGAFINVQGGIQINKAGTGTDSDYVQNNGTIKISSDGVPGQSDIINNVSGLKTFSTGQTTGEVIFASDNETEAITGSGSVEFMNLTVNNTLPPTVNLGQDVTVNGILNIGGLINVKGNNLTLLSSGALAGMPFSAGNMIIADSTGQFIRQVTAGANSWLFPVGDRTQAYSPVSLNFSSNPDAGSVGLNLKPVIHPQMNNPINATDYLKRYWTFSNTGLTTYNYTGTFKYLTSDIVGTESKMKVSRWANPWYAHTGSIAQGDSLEITNALNETIAPLTGDFTGRNPDCVPNNLIVTALHDTICQGTIGHLSVTGNTLTSLQWQSSGSAVGSYSNISGATQTNYISNPLNDSAYYRVVTTVNSICHDTSSGFKISILPSPIAKYSTGITGRTIAFNSDSSTDVSSYFWDFGDGKSSTIANPTHRYDTAGNYHVCLTVKNTTNCTFTLCKNILTQPDGVNNINLQNEFQVYPDPFTNQLVIVTTGTGIKPVSIEMYNVLGQRVLNKDVNGFMQHTTVLDVSALTEGAYYLRIKTGNGDFVKPLIK